MAEDLSDLEIAVLCDLLEGHGANLKSHKKTVLEQLIAKRLVEPAKTTLQNSNSVTRLATLSRSVAWE